MSFGQYFNILSRSTNTSPLAAAAQQAAQIKSNAALAAGSTGQAYLQQGIGNMQTGNQQSLGYRQPYIQAGQQGLGQAVNMAGLGPMSADQVLQQMMVSPAYTFNRDEALKQIERSAGAKGKLYSGQSLQAIADRSSQLAGSEFDRQQQNALAIAQLGAGFAGQQAGQEFALGTNTADFSSRIGDTLGNAGLASAQAQAEGIVGSAGANVTQSTIAGLNGTAVRGVLGGTVAGGGAFAGTATDNDPWGSGDGNPFTQLGQTKGGVTSGTGQYLAPKSKSGGAASNFGGYNYSGGSSGGVGSASQAFRDQYLQGGEPMINDQYGDTSENVDLGGFNTANNAVDLAALNASYSTPQYTEDNLGNPLSSGFSGGGGAGIGGASALGSSAGFGGGTAGGGGGTGQSGTNSMAVMLKKAGFNIGGMAAKDVKKLFTSIGGAGLRKIIAGNKK